MVKVVIGAAGQGTRMQELTEAQSKHLIKVGNRPFLAYLLDNLILAGYNDFVLVVGFRPDLMEKFRVDFLDYTSLPQFLETISKPGLGQHEVKIELVNQFKIIGPKEKIYGTA